MPASGDPIAFSHLQAVFNGEDPISIDEYYQDASTGYTSGVTGIPNINSGTPNINSPISLYMFYDKAKPASSLYSFTTHTFTNANATGKNGPILTQVQSAYNTVNWTQNTAYLTMNTQGIQEWTVPTSGYYSIEVAGASGGTNNRVGGKGAKMKGTFILIKGMVLAILVGQLGGVGNTGYSNCNAGGGGGTFVWGKTDITLPLIVGGGGGGGGASFCNATHGLNASTTTNGTGGFTGTTAGANGNGATPGGSGWVSNGTSGYYNNNINNRRPLEGGFGGSRASLQVGDGGFGGGASGSGNLCSAGGPGGGGGYSGGAGPSANNVCTITTAAGGGGSYIDDIGTDQTKIAGVHIGHGYVTINYLLPLPAGSYTYSFTTHTFTNAGATGRTGPTLEQVRTEYSTTSWAQNMSYLNMTTQGIQEWTVPATRSYSIECRGGGGAGSPDTGTYPGGNGAKIIGTFILTQGEVLCIVIGQLGVFGPNLGFGPDSGGGGGGGSFVYRKTDSLLYIVAGGGGGGGYTKGFGGGGSATKIPVNGGGGSGNGGYQGIGYGGNGGGLSINYDTHPSNAAAGGGGGWLSGGGNGVTVMSQLTVGYGGAGRSSDFIGGYHASYNTNGGPGNGGFGGGGGGSGGGGGGGGGYTGGGGGNNYALMPGGTAHPGYGGGQGGGSYNIGANKTTAEGVNTGHGYVIITAN
jgi:hypothetical protein